MLSIREKLHPERFTSVLAAGALSSPRRRGAPSRTWMCFVTAPMGIFGKDAHDGSVGLVQRLSVPSPTGTACPTPLSMGMLGAAPRTCPNLSPGEFPARGSISSLASLGSLVPNSVPRHTEPFFSSLWLHEQFPYQHHGLCSELAGAVQGLAARSRRWHGEPGHLTSGD